MVGDGSSGTRTIQTFCALCISRCGAVATVEGDRLVALAPDPSHPTGRALCVKGKAAPEIVAHPDRLEHPLRRTAPKGAADPGWERISWDEALDLVATKLLDARQERGPASVVFSSTSPSTSAMSDAIDWLGSLQRAFGSPNFTSYMELCGWGRHLAPLYTFGAPVPGAYMPDIERAGCLLYWGFNPSVAWLDQATASMAALRRGAKLVVIDPRRVGLAAKADHWLRVRPGTDAALALGLVRAMIGNRWYDEDFVRSWTNAPLLVRDDTDVLLRAADCLPGGDAAHLVAWGADGPVGYDPASGRYGADAAALVLRGRFEVETGEGRVGVRPVFERLAEHCSEWTPGRVEEVTGVPAAEVEATARTLWEARPLAFYTWSGLEQHSNSTQTARAIGVLYALTGCLDVPGGNVLFEAVPTALPSAFAAPPGPLPTLGAATRPLGPARFGLATGPDVYTAALAGEVGVLVNFGANLVMAHGDSARGRDALAAVDFMVHADLFLSPTADLADVVLPVCSPFEAEGLRMGFETSQAARSRVQLHPALVPPRGESRSDLAVILALAARLGLGEDFFDGDVDAAFRHQLAPSGVTLEQLREHPGGVDVPLTTRHRKYADAGRFRTPTGKVELWSATLHDGGHPALPTFAEPPLSPRALPDLAKRYPLVLSCAKSVFFRETQDRGVPSLRHSAPDPIVEIHPETAASRGITAGAWVAIATPTATVRARAKLNPSLDPGVVFGQHGWWQANPELGLPALPPYGPDTANLNLALTLEPADPVSGSSPLRSSLCEVRLL